MNKALLTVCFVLVFTSYSNASNTSRCTSYSHLDEVYVAHDGFKPTDPDLLELLKSIASKLEKNGYIDKRFKEHRELIQKWSDTPVAYQKLPQALTCSVNSFSTDLPSTLPIEIKQALKGFERIYLMVDAQRENEVLFLEKIKASISLDDRIVLVAGSVLDTTKRLDRQVYFDQAGVLQKRFFLKQTPALVRVTAEQISVVSPALNEYGDVVDTCAIERNSAIHDVARKFGVAK